MNLKEYYHKQFASDLAALYHGFEPHEHAGILALGHIWTHGCSALEQIPAIRRPQFLSCLYFTVLIDQAMHSTWQSRRFEELTHYPKFRVGLGHAAHLNPILILETPCQRGFVSGDAIKEIVPTAMTLFVEETSSFFRDHMPDIESGSFFERLLNDPDINCGMDIKAFVDNGLNVLSLPLRQFVPAELAKAVAADSSGKEK